MRYGEEFRTCRLVARRLRSSDAYGLERFYSDPDVVRWIDDSKLLSRTEAIRWIEATLHSYDTPGYGLLAIEFVTMSKIVGYGGLTHIKMPYVAQVEYAFRPELWGLGLATEFVKGLLNYGATVHGLTHAVANVAEANLASQRVLTKAGFLASRSRFQRNRPRCLQFVTRTSELAWQDPIRDMQP